MRVVLREVEALTQPPRLQGLYPRRGRPHRQLPPPLLQEADEGGNVHGTEPAWPPRPVPTWTRTTPTICTLLRKIRQAAGGEKGVHPLRHPVRLHAGRTQSGDVLCRAGEVPCQRPAEGGPGALRAPRCWTIWASPISRSMRSSSGKYERLNQKYGKEQYLVPYLMSSHPGCTLDDAVRLAEWINAHRPPAGAGAGLLPHAGYPVHLHVLHRH